MANLTLYPDTADTEWRVAIRQLYERRGIAPCGVHADFRCAHVESCSSIHGRPIPFHTGTWPYVGISYGEASVLGQSFRLLFVAMERGGKFNPAGELTFADTQWAFRNSALDRSNPHMGGTSQLVEALVDEKMPEAYVTQFALTNAVKCVTYTQSMKSTSTGTMIGKCGDHLRAEIDILRPDLIVTQGSHPAGTVQRLFPDLHSVGDFAGDAGRSTVLAGATFIVVTTPHPARRKGWRWKRGPLPIFLRQAVQKALHELIALRA